MDLDALKSGLNRRLEQPVTRFSSQLVCKRPRSRGLMIKLRRNLWLETAIYVLSIPVMIFMAWRVGGLALYIYVLTCSVVMCFLVPIFIGLARRITRHLHADTTVHEGLKELLGIMKTYQKRYLQFNLIMAPVCLVYAIALTIAFPGMEMSEAQADPIQIDAWLIWLLILGAVAMFMLSIWYVSKWWIHWLYGRYIRDLEQELSEVESTEE
jgi:hypothetical protein